MAAGNASANANGSEVLASSSRPQPTPLLLGLEPDIGPLDGGTRVSLGVLGLCHEDVVEVTIEALSMGATGVAERPRRQVPLRRDDGEWFFEVPDFRVAAPSHGALVSLATADGVPLTGPLFFWFTAPLQELAPQSLEPCCELHISGGERLRLSGAPGSISRLPAKLAGQARVRFRGVGHEQEVEAQFLDHGVGSSNRAWVLQVIAPPWPRAEGKISLEVSFNGQQFAPLGYPLHFVEELSFLSDVANGLSEDHLPGLSSFALLPPDLAAALEGNGQGHDAHLAEAPQMQMTVLDETQSGTDGQTIASDFSHAVLVDNLGDAFVLTRSRDVTHLQEDLRLVHDLFLLTCAATVGGALAGQIGLPSVIGFLVGGAAVGPGGLNVILELVQVESVADIGVVLLVFDLGLHLSWTKLLANKNAALAGVVTMVSLCCVLGLIASFAQTSMSEALSIGFFVCFASTPVALRAIPESVLRCSGDFDLEVPAVKGAKTSGMSNEESGALLAILVAQDMTLAFLLAAFPWMMSLLSTRTDAHPNPARSAPGSQHLLPLSQILLVMLGAQFVVIVLISNLKRFNVVNIVERMSGGVRGWLLGLNDESYALMVLSYAFAFAYLSDYLGLSIELGSFMAGLFLTGYSRDVAVRAQERLGALKDTFAALFFASIGLVVNARFLLDNLAAIVSVVGFIFVMKVFTGFLPLWFFASPDATAPAITSLRVACVLAHVGEFGFVLAAKGMGWGLISRHVYFLLVGANVVSLCTAPWLSVAVEYVVPRDLDMSSNNFLLVSKMSQTALE